MNGKGVSCNTADSAKVPVTRADQQAAAGAAGKEGQCFDRDSSYRGSKAASLELASRQCSTLSAGGAERGRRGVGG